MNQYVDRHHWIEKYCYWAFATIYFLKFEKTLGSVKEDHRTKLKELREETKTHGKWWNVSHQEWKKYHKWGQTYGNPEYTNEKNK